MPRLNDTLVRLNAMRDRPFATGGDMAGIDRLSDLGGFGDNPGALHGRYYVPDNLADNAPLVVVLHGCTQDAAAYDHGSGWSRLADECGFAVLFPEQRRANNPNLCFNWFNAEDIRRDSGEAMSIRQMTDHMIAAHRLDPARVYVTGLSAGGAMASVMLATYPERFAGGAIIAGLPFGTAQGVPQAFDRMRAHGGPAGAALGDLVTAASTHDGPWPVISIWHGDGDMTVSPANADLIVDQWRGLHGLAAPTRTETVSGHARRIWTNGDGREVMEAFDISGLGHGTPLSTGGPDACGVAGPYMLEAGISSTRHIARFWGLAEAGGARRAVAAHAPPPERGRPTVVGTRTPPPPAAGGVGQIIEKALRAAGLMR